MKRNHFRLEKLLDIRIMNERYAASRLSETDALLTQVKDDIRALKERESMLYSTFISSVQNQKDLTSVQNHLSALKEESIVLKNLLKKLEEKKADAHIVYVDALKKRKILENLKDKTLNKA